MDNKVVFFNPDYKKRNIDETGYIRISDNTKATSSCVYSIDHGGGQAILAWEICAQNMAQIITEYYNNMSEIIEQKKELYLQYGICDKGAGR